MFRERLRHNDSIKRIPVMERESLQCENMRQLDGQQLKQILLPVFLNDAGKRAVEVKFAE